MDEGIIDKRVENGVVWVRAQVNGGRYDLGALCDERWRLRLLIARRGEGDKGPRGLVRAKQVACAWADANPAEVEALFREAAKQRESRQVRTPPETLDTH